MQNYINQTVAAAYLDVSPRTMERWRYTGIGPAFSRLGGSDRGKVVYAQDELDAYLERNKQEPKSNVA